MSVTRLFHTTALAAFALILFATGCVGPMACGPHARGPLSLNHCDGCGDCNGCGELYIDPWINHPAQCGDPCDQCGNFNGQSCGKCRSVFSGIRSLWGYRCGVDDGCDSGACDAGGCGPLLGGLDQSCDTCCDGNGGYLEHDHRPGCGCEASCGFENGSTFTTSSIAHAPDVVEVYRPRRERQIFTPRRD